MKRQLQTLQIKHNPAIHTFVATKQKMNAGSHIIYRNRKIYNGMELANLPKPVRRSESAVFCRRSYPT
jgi:hypothetical protein